MALTTTLVSHQHPTDRDDVADGKGGKNTGRRGLYSGAG